jgi:hypothetical protein
MITAQVIGGKLPSVQYIGTASGTINTTATYTGQSIGNPGGGRRYLIVAAINSGGLITTIPTGVTCNGEAMTLLANNTRALLSNYMSFWGLAVPNGTTADFIVTMSNGIATQASISVWSVKSIRSMTPTATSLSSANPAALSLDVQPRGIVIAASSSAQSGSAYTWAGLTEDYESNITVGNNPVRSGASAVSPLGATPLAVTCTYSSVSAGNMRALAIALR